MRKIKDLKNPSSIMRKRCFLLCVLHFAFCVSLGFAQSINQSYPTAVTTNEISGAIRARDLGDARLTSYYYVSNAGQGDVFINVVSSNLNGNIDVFAADGLRPLTKIIVFADVAASETGRVVYLRKPERLLLRVEGRTPNDDAATFKIKFAGSFQALKENEKIEAPDEPKVASSGDPDVRVNSVGTIISVKPRPTPTETTARTKDEETKDSETNVGEKSQTESTSKNADQDVVRQISVETNAEKAVIAETNVAGKDERKIEIAESENKIQVVVTDNAASSTEKINASTEPAKTPETEETETAKTETARSETTKTEAEKNAARRTARTTKNSSAVSPRAAARNARLAKAAELNAALENIRLVVVMKDGAKIEKPMSEVLRVGVDKGVLTVIAKDGTISRYSILDVAKMSIE